MTEPTIPWRLMRCGVRHFSEILYNILQAAIKADVMTQYNNSMRQFGTVSIKVEGVRRDIFQNLISVFKNNVSKSTELVIVIELICFFNIFIRHLQLC